MGRADWQLYKKEIKKLILAIVENFRSRRQKR